MFYKIKEYIRSNYFILCNTISQILSFFVLKNEEYKCSYKINYYSQWESRNLNKRIELHAMEASEDPLWKNSGADSKEEYQRWSENICAIACFKMILDNFGLISKNVKSISLAKQSAEYGAYKYKDNKQKIEGIFWKPFQKFILEKYNIKSCIVNCLTVPKMSRLLIDNQIVFLSVSPFFHYSNKKVKITKRTGHVILVHGFISKNGIIQGFFVKDPGAWTENNSQEYFVDTKKLLLYYSGRAFIILRQRKKIDKSFYLCKYKTSTAGSVSPPLTNK